MNYYFMNFWKDLSALGIVFKENLMSYNSAIYSIMHIVGKKNDVKYHKYSCGLRYRMNAPVLLNIHAVWRYKWSMIVLNAIRTKVSSWISKVYRMRINY